MNFCISATALRHTKQLSWGEQQKNVVMIFLKIETAGGKWKVLSLFKVIGK